jgi:hypothetical protein
MSQAHKNKPRRKNFSKTGDIETPDNWRKPRGDPFESDEKESQSSFVDKFFKPIQPQEIQSFSSREKMNPPVLSLPQSPSQVSQNLSDNRSPDTSKKPEWQIPKIQYGQSTQVSQSELPPMPRPNLTIFQQGQVQPILPPPPPPSSNASFALNMPNLLSSANPLNLFNQFNSVNPLNPPKIWNMPPPACNLPGFWNSPPPLYSGPEFSSNGHGIPMDQPVNVQKNIHPNSMSGNHSIYVAPEDIGHLIKQFGDICTVCKKNIAHSEFYFLECHRFIHCLCFRNFISDILPGDVSCPFCQRKFCFQAILIDQKGSRLSYEIKSIPSCGEVIEVELRYYEESDYGISEVERYLYPISVIMRFPNTIKGRLGFRMLILAYNVGILVDSKRGFLNFGKRLDHNNTLSDKEIDDICLNIGKFGIYKNETEKIGLFEKSLLINDRKKHHPIFTDWFVLNLS